MLSINFCHIGYVHLKSSGSWHISLRVSSSKSIFYIISSTASSLRYQIPSPWWPICPGNILKRYLPFMANKNCLHRMKTCIPFPIALSMLPSLGMNPSCLTLLSINPGCLTLYLSIGAIRWQYAHLNDSGSLFTYLTARTGVSSDSPPSHPCDDPA